MLALPRFISPPRQPRPSRPHTTFASLRTAAQGLSKSAPSPLLGEKSAPPFLPPRSSPPAARNRHQLFATECARVTVPCLALAPVDESEAEEDGLEEALDALLDRARAKAPQLQPRPAPKKRRNLRKAPFRPRLTPIDEVGDEEDKSVASSAAGDSLSAASTASSSLSLSLSSGDADTPASTPSSSCPTSPTKTSSAPAPRPASLSSSRTTTSPTIIKRTTRLLTLLRTLAPRPTLAAVGDTPSRPRRSKQASLTSRSSSSSSTIASLKAPKESTSAWARDREGARAALRGTSAGRGRGEEEQEKREGKCVRGWWGARAVGLGAHEERLETEVKVRGEEGVKVRVEVEEEWIEWAGL